MKLEDLKLAELCELLGWQGGTIWEARVEARRRLARDGIFEDQEGHLRRMIPDPFEIKESIKRENS